MRVRGDTSICRAPVFNKVEHPRFLCHVCVVGVCVCALLVLLFLSRGGCGAFFSAVLRRGMLKY